MKHIEKIISIHKKENKKYRRYSGKLSYTLFGVPEGAGGRQRQYVFLILAWNLPEIVKDNKDSKSQMNLKPDKKISTFINTETTRN